MQESAHFSKIPNCVQQGASLKEATWHMLKKNEAIWHLLQWWAGRDLAQQLRHCLGYLSPTLKHLSLSPRCTSNSSFLLTHTCGSNKWWFKYLDPCCPYRTSRWARSAWLIHGHHEHLNSSFFSFLHSSLHLSFILSPSFPPFCSSFLPSTLYFFLFPCFFHFLTLYSYPPVSVSLSFSFKYKNQSK